MRISDWGSDVRSSDLYGQHGAAAHPADQPLAVARRHPAEEQDIAVATRHYCGSGDPPHDQVPAAGHLGGDRIARESGSADLDRKSVVWGKRVVVRIDLGGRR